MYARKSFKRKKDLKEAVKNGEKITLFQPGPFGGNEPKDGEVSIEGPNFVMHTWYARVKVKDGIIISVK